METTAEGSGSGKVAYRGDGDPESIRELATWLRDVLAVAVSESSCLVGGASVEVLHGWTDEAGQAFDERLRSGARHMVSFHDDIRRIARELDDYADTLESAQRKIDDARSIITSAEHIDVLNGIAFPPNNLPPRTGSDQYDHQVPIDRDTYLREMDKFSRVSSLVHSARDQVVDRDDALEQLVEYAEDNKHFLVGNFVTGEGEYLADLVENRFVRSAGRYSESAAARFADAARIKDLEHLGPLRTIIGGPARLAGTIDTKVMQAARAGATGMSWISRACRVGGPGLTIFSVAVDLHNGEPMQRVFTSTALGLLATGAIIVLFPGPGWFVAGAAVLAGMAGSEGGERIYDTYLMKKPLVIDDGWAWQPG